MHYNTHIRTAFLWRIRIYYYYNTRYSVNGSEKLDSSGLNLNWIKMLTRTQEYIPGARVLLDLGNVSVNRRIFINIYNIICTQTHIAARVGTCRINYVFSSTFSRHDVSVVIVMMYTSRVDILLPSKLFMETKAIEWCFLILLRYFYFHFFSHARIDMYLFINI